MDGIWYLLMEWQIEHPTVQNIQWSIAEKYTEILGNMFVWTACYEEQIECQWKAVKNTEKKMRHMTTFTQRPLLNPHLGCTEFFYWFTLPKSACSMHLVKSNVQWSLSCSCIVAPAWPHLGARPAPPGRSQIFTCSTSRCILPSCITIIITMQSFKKKTKNSWRNPKNPKKAPPERR